MNGRGRRCDRPNEAGDVLQDVAVVGMALRVPGAVSPKQFWKNIVGGVDCLTRTTRDQLEAAGFRAQALKDPRFVLSKPLIHDVEYFDADLFGMPPPEVERTDPSHRIFLEVVWEALERAGIAPGREPSIGVFAGSGAAPGASYLVRNLVPRDEDLNDPVFAIPARLGNFSDFLSTRVSYALDLVGPSFGVQAACATSLLAVHLAKESILRGECKVALAGGACVEATQSPGYLSGVDGMLSASGVVRTFDASADGTVFGSGVAVVVLERLADALAAGHPVHAVIRGSGSSNDGAPKGKASFVAPSSEGQIQAISRALEEGGVDPATIGYVEVHGTATSLGDPVEIDALTQVFRRYTEDRHYCAVGSVKPNVGHLRQAAGVVGLIKACLALKERVLPPSTNLESLNPDIAFESSPFYTPSAATEWDPSEHPRRASVSAFGFGGTNSHVVLEEPPPRVETEEPQPRRELLIASAQTPRALDRLLSDLGSHVRATPELRPADVAHTLRHGRKALAHRAVAVVEGGQRFAAGALHRERWVRSSNAAVERATVFMFPGQGSQRPGMGRSLHDAESVYGQAVDECAELLQPIIGADIRTLLYPGPDVDGDAALEALRQTTNAQSALFVVEYAMAQLFLSWGCKPDAMLGHSIGEYVAACVSGVFSLAEALEVVAIRGKLMQACDPGAMLAVFLSEADVGPWLSDRIELAAINGPMLTVVAGTEPDIDELAKRLDDQGVISRRLLTSHAFHSWMMEPALVEFGECLGRITLKDPKIPFVSNVTGRCITVEQATDPEYWVQQIRRPVRFAEGIQTLTSDGDPVFIELGPGRTLTGHVDRQIESSDAVPAMARKDGGSVEDEQYVALEALGRAWTAGASVDWPLTESRAMPRTVELPTYPFQRNRYWLDPSPESEGVRDYSHDPAMYEIAWREAGLEAEPDPAEEGVWTLLGGDEAFTDVLKARLRKLGGAVVSIPQTFSEVELTQAISSTSEAHPEGPIRVLFLGLVTGDEGPHHNIEALDLAIERGFFQLIEVAKVAYRLRIADRLRMIAAADGLVVLDGESATRLHAEKAVLFGPARVIPQEIPGLSLRVVDVPLLQAQEIPEWLVDAILTEAGVAADETVAALRPEGRYIEGYRELGDLSLGKMRLREGGTVLITGGVGGLGLKVASALFERARARIVLTSRWEAPPRDHWESMAESPDEIGRALRAVLALERRGADVMIVTADVADEDSMTAAVRRVRSEFGPIHGLVHAAGVVDDGPVVTKTRETAKKVFGAKTRGAIILDQIFSDIPLDFVAYFSSQAACLPGPGRIDYTAANSVLDSLARRRTAEGRAFHCSIGWGAWRDVGMAARMEAKPRPSADSERDRELLDHPLVQYRELVESGRSVYGGKLHPKTHWILDEHRIGGRAIMPAVGIVESVRAAYGHRMGIAFGIEISELTFLRPLFVDDRGRELQIEFEQENGAESFQLRSRSNDLDGWTVHAVGTVAKVDPRARLGRLAPMRVAARARTPRSYAGATAPDGSGNLQSSDKPVGLAVEFGPRFQCLLDSEWDGDVTRLWVAADEGSSAESHDLDMRPELLDQAISETGNRFAPQTVPFYAEKVRLYGEPPPEAFAEGHRRQVAGVDLFDVCLTDPAGNVLIQLEGLSKRPITSAGSSPEEEGGATLAGANRLRVGQPGVLSTLALEPAQLGNTPPGHVKIEVVAAGLNFRDVLSAMGQLAGVEGGIADLGSECSGWVVEVGEGVEDVRVGDAVAALARGSLASHVLTDARLAVPIPDVLGFEDAAGIPIVFLTADYALNHLAGLAENERVLIHSATGGVGSAAVQIAQNVGAQIFATAGSPAKRACLEELGVEHVMDSRSLSFVDEVREKTGGEGVDVVLNALAGEFIPASLELLRPFGRFLEIGKRDLYDHMNLDLYPFHKNLAYFVVDLGLLMSERPDELNQHFSELIRRFETGELAPSPTTVFDMTDAGSGFGHLARAEHIGKIVFTVDRGSSARAGAGRDRFRELFGQGISVRGGLGAFRRLLSSDEAPPHALVLPKLLDSGELTSLRDRATSSYRPRPQLPTPMVAASDPDEELLVEVWQEVLGLAPIGVDDDFFQLGGNSMTALQLAYTAGQRLGLSLPNTAVFTYPTVAELSKAIAHLASE